MTNYYAMAIDICSSDQDWKTIAINIAKKHPKHFVEAANIVDWRHEARKLYFDDGQKIKAIKHCRSMTGMSLKEAKEAVESLGPLSRAGNS